MSELKPHLKEGENLKAKIKKDKNSNEWKIEEIYIKIETPEPIEYEDEADLIKDENGNSQDENQNELRAECTNNLQSLAQVPENVEVPENPNVNIGQVSHQHKLSKNLSARWRC